MTPKNSIKQYIYTRHVHDWPLFHLIMCIPVHPFRGSSSFRERLQGLLLPFPSSDALLCYMSFASREMGIYVPGCLMGNFSVARNGNNKNHDVHEYPQPFKVSCIFLAQGLQKFSSKVILIIMFKH